MKRWPTKRLGEVAAIQMGQSPPGDSYNTIGEGLPFFQGKAEFGQDSPTTIKWCTRPSRIAEQGDILLSVRAPVGPSNFAAERCCIGRGLAAIRGNSGQCNQGYVRYFLKRFEAVIAALGVGSTFPAINRRDIEQLELPVPPLIEQERIVKLLDEADELRKLRAQADTRTAQLIPALFHEMFGDPAANSQSWRMQKISTIGEVQGGLQLTQARSTHSLKRPYLRVANVQRGFLVLNELKQIGLLESEYQRTQLQKGDLLLVEGNGNPQEVGRAAIWDGSIPNCVHQNHLIRVRPHTASVTSDYLLQFVNSPSGRLYFRGAGKTTSGLSTITTTIVKNCEIPVPPVALQHEFAQRVQEIRGLQATQTTSRRRTEDLFQSMLNKAFNGDL